MLTTGFSSSPAWDQAFESACSPSGCKVAPFRAEINRLKKYEATKNSQSTDNAANFSFFCKTPSAMLIGKGIEFCNSTSNTLVQKMVGYGDINFLIILLSDVLLGCSLHSIDKLIKQLTYLLNKICFPFTVPRCTCVSRE